MCLDEFDNESKFDFELLYQQTKLKIKEYKIEFGKLLENGEIQENQFEEYIDLRLKKDGFIS